MFRRIFYPGLLAGLIAGVFVFSAQQLELVPLVFEAETYENAVGAHGHAEAQPAAEEASRQESVHIHDDGERHVHGEGEWSPSDGLERTMFSLFSSLVTAVGFGLILSAAIAFTGRIYGWRQGVVWGLAGFVAVHLSPAFSLPPELPGMASEADLMARQTWSIATTVFTAAGLALIAFRDAWLWRIAGAALIVLPHFFAVERTHVDHAIPVELASQFIVSTLVVTALFWMLLGGLTAYLTDRKAHPA